MNDPKMDPLKEKSEEIAPNPCSGWLRNGAWAAVGLVLIVAGFLMLLPKPVDSIEMGYFKEDVERVNVPGCKLIPFKTRSELAAWCSQPLPKGKKARVWMDDKRDALHVLQRDAAGRILELQFPLPHYPAARQQQIQSLIREMK